MGRELTIWKPLLEGGTSLDECLAVIEGARSLQLAGGVQRGGEFEALDWLKGEKLTGRIFNNTRSGAVPVWQLALEAHSKGSADLQPRRAAMPSRGRGGAPVPVGSLVGGPR